MNKQTGIQIMAFLCSVLFLMVGFSKLLGYTEFLKTLGESPLVGRFAPWLSIVLPVVEIIAGTAILLPRFQRYGFISIAVMMVVFTLYNIYLLKFAPHVPCSCGGIFARMSWTHHLYVNIFFTALAIYGWRLITHHKLQKP